MTIKFKRDKKTFETPFRPEHLTTRFGGKVVEVTGCGHTVERPEAGYSRDDWYMTTLVKYEDGPDSGVRNLHPSQILYEGDHDGPGHAEVCELSRAMTEYLAMHGSFRDSSPRGWNATRPSRSSK